MGCESNDATWCAQFGIYMAVRVCYNVLATEGTRWFTLSGAPKQAFTSHERLRTVSNSVIGAGRSQDTAQTPVRAAVQIRPGVQCFILIVSTQPFMSLLQN